MNRKRKAFIVLMASLLAARPCLKLHADLRHRYLFDGPSASTNVADTVGTANGFLAGSAALSGDGRLLLDGTPGYVQLPGHLLDGYNAVTVEAWASFGQNGNWTRLFDFGDTDANGLGQNYIFFTPHSGAGDIRLVISDTDPGFNDEQIASIPGNLDNLGMMHLAAVLDPANGFEGFYTNGVLAAANTNLTLTLSTVSNALSYIGKSLYNPDAYLTGTLYEFRLYDNALAAGQIAADATNPPPPVDLGALQAIHLQVDATMFLGARQTAKVLGDYANRTNVVLTGNPGITFQSSQPTAVQVTTNGVVQALKLGDAILTASYQGRQATQAVTVILMPAVLTHRYSFNDTPGSTNVADSVGTANGLVLGGATLNGDGTLTLDGTSGYVQLPRGTISKMTNATFEAWVTPATPEPTWERIFDFGSNSGGAGNQGTGQTYLFLTPRGDSGVVRFAATVSSAGGERPILNGAVPLSTDRKSYVTVVYNVSAQIAKLYVNGVLVASGVASIALKNIQDVNNWLGRSQWPDPYFNGSFDEFRIYEGALTDAQVALNAAAGPNLILTNTGPLQSISLAANATNLLVGALPTAVLADFLNLSNVNVTGFPGVQVTSSDTNVVTVTTNGQVASVATGMAIVTASYQGQQATLPVTVILPPGAYPPALIHRYSFNDGPGSLTAKDSTGTADGGLIGTGSFTTNGMLSLAGTDGYVEFPGGLISSLTNVSFEAWVTWQSSRTWERIFDFGDNSGGPGAQGTGQTYLFLTPRGGSGVVRFAATVNSGGGETPVLNGSAALPRGAETFVAVTYDILAGAARLYVNGQPVAAGPATIPLSGINDVNDWLGRSQWRDPYFTGSFDEFRIYDGALSGSQVAADFAAGPDLLANEVAARSLGITIATNAVTISWSTNATGFTLESSAALGANATWTAVGGTPTVQNGRNQLAVLFGGSTTFYRLRK